jgi:hypothetical protein
MTQVETKKETLVPKNLEIVFNDGKEQLESEIKYKPLKPKRFNDDLIIVRTSADVTPTKVKVQKIDSLAKGSKTVLKNQDTQISFKNSYDNKVKPEESPYRVRTTDALQINKNKSTGYN